MTLDYINDQQIIRDAAQMLIETHLQWSGSGKEVPSRDLDNIYGGIRLAYRKANATAEEWLAMSDADRDSVIAHASLLFEKAALMADRKWLAAMTLLGIEQ